MATLLFSINCFSFIQVATHAYKAMNVQSKQVWLGLRFKSRIKACQNITFSAKLWQSNG